MTQTSAQRRNFLKTTLTTAAVAGAAVPLTAHAQATVTWRMQALWDGGTTPQKFEEKFVARVAELTVGVFASTCFRRGRSFQRRRLLTLCVVARSR